MRSIFALILPFSLILVGVPLARGQVAPNEPAVLNGTTFGQSQNDARDLANSLVPGEKKFGKGEKKLQVNAAELKSKSIKDATFGGSLLNEGIDASAPKLDASKEHAAPSEEKPSTKTTSTEQTSDASQQPASNEQSSGGTNQPQIYEPSFSFSNISQTATLADDLSQADVAAAPAPQSKSGANSSANGDTQKKDQGDEKPSNTTEKPSDH